MPIMVRQTHFNDFEALRDGWQDVEFDIVQVENGQMHGAVSHFSLDTIGLSTGDYSRGLRASGLGSDHRWVFSTQIEDSETSTINRIKLKAGDQSIIRPNHEFAFANEHGGHYAAAFVEPDELFDYLETRQPGAADLKLWRETLSVQALNPADAAARVQYLQMLLTTLNTEGPTMSADTADFYKRSIMGLIAAPILNSVDYRGSHLGAPDRLVREVQHFLTTTGPRPVHISEICERFRVHERTLFRAFHDVVGKPPMAYLRTLRLNHVYSELRRNGREMTVKAVAVAHGFPDLSRFAAEYRRMFDEHPRQTLRRSTHAVVTVIFLLFAGICMNYDYDDCDDDDYFIFSQQYRRPRRQAPPTDPPPRRQSIAAGPARRA